MKERQLAINLISVDSSGEVDFETTQNHFFDVGQRLKGIEYDYEITEVIAPFAYVCKCKSPVLSTEKQDDYVYDIINRDLANGFIIGDPPEPKKDDESELIETDVIDEVEEEKPSTDKPPIGELAKPEPIKETPKKSTKGKGKK